MGRRSGFNTGRMAKYVLKVMLSALAMDLFFMELFQDHSSAAWKLNNLD